MKGIRTVAVYGGANIVTQINQLKRPCQVVIATPGRLIDLAKRKAVKLDQVQVTSCSTRPMRCSTWASRRSWTPS